MEELIETIGYLYQRSGKDILSEKDLVLSISMDLGWFSPDEAKQLINIGTELKLLSREDEGLKPCFDYKVLSIPIDFTPTKNVLQLDTQEPLLLSIVRSIREKTGLERINIMSEINKKQNKLDLEIEVAAILVAKKYEIDVSGFLKEAEMSLFNRTEKKGT